MTYVSSYPSSIPANEDIFVFFIVIHDPSKKALNQSKPTSGKKLFQKKCEPKKKYCNNKKKAILCVNENNQYISTDMTNITSNIFILLKLDDNNSWSIIQIN